MKGGGDLLFYNSSLAKDRGRPDPIQRRLCEQKAEPPSSLRGVDVLIDSSKHSSAMKDH